MPWTIYCHVHVESGRRYVGMTAQTMERRWSSHVTKSRSSKGGRWHFPNAIRKYGPQAFSHEVLEVCHILDVANLAEECWIEFFDTRDPERGFNLAKGGRHVPHPEKENPWDDPSFRAKCIASLRLSASQPGAKALRSAVARESANRPEVRLKNSLAQKEVMGRPGMREKNSQRVKALWQSEGYRAKQSARWGDPGYRNRSHDGLTGGARVNREKTHCPKGHEYTPKNTRLKNGRRECVTCGRENVKTRMQKLRSRRSGVGLLSASTCAD